MSSQEPVIFVSNYSRLSIEPLRVKEKQVVSGEVITVSKPGPDIEFQDGKFVTADPDTIEHLRDHHRYAAPDERMDGRVKVFTEVSTDEEADEATKAEPSNYVNLQNGERVAVSELIEAYQEKKAAAEASQAANPEADQGALDALVDAANDAPADTEGTDGELEPLYAMGGEEVSNKQEAIEALAGADARPEGVNTDSKVADVIEAAHAAGYYFPGYE